MKIVQFIYDSPRNPWVGGGGALRVQNILKCLECFGHEITVVCGKCPGVDKIDSWNGLNYFPVGSRANNYLVSTLAYTLMAQNYLSRKSHQFDVIIEDFAPWNPLYSYNNPSGTPAVLQVQNFLGAAIPKKYPIIGNLFQWFESDYPHKFKSRIFVNQSLESAFMMPGKIIPMGVESSAIDLPLNIGKYIGFLGRIDFAQKGLQDLIEAAALLTTTPIKIAGRGPDEKRLQKAIEPYPHMEWVGPVSGMNKWKFLKDCQILTMPSNFEGQPLVALEAAAIGTPIIASKIRELDFVEATKLGAQVDTKDPICFSNCMQEWFLNPEKCRETGLAGKEFARTKTWECIAKDFEEYCFSML